MDKNKRFLFTSESVAEGHPDKMADQISDGILDAMIEQDKYSRVAVETLLTTGLVVVAGEVTTRADADIQAIVRNTIKEIGYDDAKKGFDWETCGILTAIHEQSPDIAQGVSGTGLHKEQGAGDQGLMFGYATRETKEMLPLTLVLAHRITERLAVCRKKKILKYLRPDGKSQVTVEYKDEKPQRVHAVVVAAQHDPDVEHDEIKEDIIKYVIKPVMPKGMFDEEKTTVFVNETGRFVIGGPAGDTGVTGRKIIVDTYGGVGSHGGGAFSGKDPSKVDRSASYAARWVAKNIIAAGMADRCEVQVAYAIGVARPVSVMVDTLGTNKIPEERIERAVNKVFDLRPRPIIEDLKLLRPIYRKTAAFGHFGRSDPDFTWEKTDRVDELRDAAGL